MCLIYIKTPHIRILLLRRFVKFYFQLKMCTKPEIINLLNLQKCDFRSTFGRNCLSLCRELNVENMESINIKNISMPIKTPVTETWRLPQLLDLMALRNCKPDDITIDEINIMVNYVCCT